MPDLLVLDYENGSAFLRRDTELTERFQAHVPRSDAMLRPELVVDPASGDDNATGAPDAPVRTLRTLVRRLGQRYAPRIAQTITLRGDVTESIDWWLDCSHATLTIRGELPAPAWQGVASAVTHRAAASNTFNGATSSWTVAEQMPRLLVHPSSGRSAWIAKDLGGGAARLSPWWRTATDMGDIAQGDALATYALPRLRGLSLYTHGGWLEGMTTGLVLRDLDLGSPPLSGRRSTFSACGNAHMERCRISHLPQVNGGQWQLRCCLVDGDVADINYFLGNLAPVNVVFAASLSRLRLELGTSVGGSVVAMSFGSLVQGAQGNGFDVHSGGVLRVVDMAVADATGNGVETKYGGHVVAGGPLCGFGNGGYGYKGHAATRAVWFDASLAQAKITGASGDYLLGVNPGTWAGLIASGGHAFDSVTGAYVGKN